MLTAGTVLAEEEYVYYRDCDLEYQEIVTSLFLQGEADSLHYLIYEWEDICGVSEPTNRTIILAAIWDGAFEEKLYKNEIIDYLIEYENLTPGDYEAFTASVADQLLPHTEIDSLEQFFCLFYSNRFEAARALLDGPALKGTYLKRIYEWELERISLERKPYSYMVTGGYWMPSGNRALAGNKFALGGGIETWRGPWFGRFMGDILLGRSRYPYSVDKGEYSGRSDRFNAFTFAAEGGITPWRKGPYSVGVYGGAGAEFLIPFLEEDVVLVNFKGLVGLGARMDLGPTRKWFVGLDARREWMTNSNGGGTPLDGKAWSFRIAFGYNRNHQLDSRLEALGH